MIRSTVVANFMIYFQKRLALFHTFATCSELPSYISTMVVCQLLWLFLCNCIFFTKQAEIKHQMQINNVTRPWSFFLDGNSEHVAHVWSKSKENACNRSDNRNHPQRTMVMCVRLFTYNLSKKCRTFVELKLYISEIYEIIFQSGVLEWGKIFLCEIPCRNIFD